MNLFDPLRPQLGGQPQLVTGGKASQVITALSVHFLPEGLEIGAFMPSDHGWSRRVRKVESAEELWELLESWRADPEECAREKFGWVEPRQLPSGQGPRVKLLGVGVGVRAEDLGL